MTPRHLVRLLGWALAVNVLTLLAAASLSPAARDATQRLALWCGLG